MSSHEHATDKPPDRQAQRRRPFSTWVRKLTNFKSSSDNDRPKRNKVKRGPKNNNPYPESGQVSNGNGNTTGDANGNDAATGTSACTFSTARQTGSNTSLDRSTRVSTERHGSPSTRRSVAETASTDHEGSQSAKTPSHGASSLAGTSRTVGGGIESRRGGDSTFSSPAPSVRSLTTTLTTIQSMAPNGTGHGNGSTSTPTQNNTQSIQFSQPFPTTVPPSAIPSHLAPTGNPSTYSSATANNLLTDNASILTLASSSKRRRRRSLDTDASVRALAPSSIWGGSRESLPLSVLSANIEASGMPPTPGLYGSSSRMGAERTSIYSATGVAPAIAGDRSSYYAKQNDGASVRSGLFGHGRAESVSGSIGGLSSPLVSPREVLNERAERVEKMDPSTPATKEE
ncbi:hypothetical protein G7046_g9659 [Stylonectria norvegica]|nr:hypothetical protein G7046_g9659 [Stylonectria norvegica]